MIVGCGDMACFSVMPIGAVITAASRPTSDWGCYEWMSWHKTLVPAYGLKIANDLWLKYWRDQSKWSNNYNWCKYNSEWAAYFKSQEIDMTHLISRTVTTAVDVTDNLLDLTGFLTKPYVLVPVLGIIAWPYIKPLLK